MFNKLPKVNSRNTSLLIEIMIFQKQKSNKNLLRCYAKRPYFRFCRCLISFLKSIICCGDKLLNFVATPRKFPFPPNRDALLAVTNTDKMIAKIISSFILWFTFWYFVNVFYIKITSRNIRDISKIKRRICLVGSFQALIRQNFFQVAVSLT